jgi:hypothetical protein
MLGGHGGCPLSVSVVEPDEIRMIQPAVPLKVMLAESTNTDYTCSQFAHSASN